MYEWPWMFNNCNLFGQLFLAEFVEDVELSGEDDVVDEADARQLDANDDGAVGHHHSYRSEVDLQVLRELLSTGVTGILLERLPFVTKKSITCRMSYYIYQI